MSITETFAQLEWQKRYEEIEFHAICGDKRVSKVKIWNGKVLMVHPRIQKEGKQVIHAPFKTIFNWIMWLEEFVGLDGLVITDVEVGGINVKNEQECLQTFPLPPWTEPPSEETIAGSTKDPSTATTTAITYDPIAEVTAVENSLQRLPNIPALHGHQERMMTKLNDCLGNPLEPCRASAFVPVAPPPLPSRTPPSNQRLERIEKLIATLTNSLREIAMTD